MENADDNVVELKRYYNKLSRAISSDGMKLINVTILNKKRIDDILVCIEASYPSFYKKYLELQNGKNIKINKAYARLMNAIKNQFIFSKSSYSVYFRDALACIEEIKANLQSDFNYITTNFPEL